jgi:hypothetical protein
MRLLKHTRQSFVNAARLSTFRFASICYTENMVLELFKISCPVETLEFPDENRQS